MKYRFNEDPLWHKFLDSSCFANSEKVNQNCVHYITCLSVWDDMLIWWVLGIFDEDVGSQKNENVASYVQGWSLGATSYSSDCAYGLLHASERVLKRRGSIIYARTPRRAIGAVNTYYTWRRSQRPTPFFVLTPCEKTRNSFHQVEHCQHPIMAQQCSSGFHFSSSKIYTIGGLCTFQTSAPCEVHDTQVQCEPTPSSFFYAPSSCSQLQMRLRLDYG